MAEPEPKYADFDGLASRFAPNEAWVLDEGRTYWTEINSGEHGNAAHELTKAQFDRLFPNVPPLPPEAFKTPRPHGG